MREIVLDTETTGMDPADGHRIVEIGCVELFNNLPTGVTWHHYINPEREIDAGAIAVHGIKNEFVKDKPIFGELVGSLMDFLGDAKLIIHNAEFDIKFLNAEFKRYGFPLLKVQDAIDTLLIARKKFPGSPANLDALCRRFNIDLSGREHHGALLDAELLALVYLELLGGRQHGLGLAPEKKPAVGTKDSAGNITVAVARPFRTARPHNASTDELKTHASMVETLKDPMWKKV